MLSSKDSVKVERHSLRSNHIIFLYMDKIAILRMTLEVETKKQPLKNRNHGFKRNL